MGESREIVVAEARRFLEGGYRIGPATTELVCRALVASEAVVEAAQKVEASYEAHPAPSGSPLGELRSALAALTTEQKPGEER
jgi:hypothetical protein